MKNSILILSLFLILVSCKEDKKQSVKKEKQTIVADTIEHQDSEITQVGEAEFSSEFLILIPSTYRDWDNSNPANELNASWFDLHQEKGVYSLSKADFEIEKGFSECSGDSTKTINSKNVTLLYLNLPQLKEGNIASVHVNKNKIWPKENTSFDFNNVKYTLRGEGKILETYKNSGEDGNEVSHKVEGYKLYISAANQPEKLLLSQQSFNDTFVELLFVGDIDADSKPDFIFRANRDYEEERVLLFLSTRANPNECVKKVAEITVQFDC
ncbi:MAG: hypothetical protein QM535_18750 [Limnohabitans sp.]|nr:hypothetical protein [Limnohabitans sp.]